MSITTHTRAAHSRVLADLSALQPYERAVRAKAVQDEANAFLGALGAMRSAAVKELRGLGLTWREVGELTGLTAGGAMDLATQRHQGRARKARKSALVHGDSRVADDK